MKRFTRIRREDGQALVEFALVLPILLMIATGITSFGLVFYRYITLTDAVHAGARKLSLGRGAPDPCTDATNQTVASADTPGVDLQPSDVTIFLGTTRLQQPQSCSGTDSYWVQGNQVTVSATIKYSLTIFGVITVKNGTLTAQATDAIE
jgi:Flp pilus assembly protein TadG